MILCMVKQMHRLHGNANASAQGQTIKLKPRSCHIWLRNQQTTHKNRLFWLFWLWKSKVQQKKHVILVILFIWHTEEPQSCPRSSTAPWLLSMPNNQNNQNNKFFVVLLIFITKITKITCFYVCFVDFVTICGGSSAQAWLSGPGLRHLHYHAIYVFALPCTGSCSNIAKD